MVKGNSFNCKWLTIAGNLIILLTCNFLSTPGLFSYEVDKSRLTAYDLVPQV